MEGACCGSMHCSYQLVTLLSLALGICRVWRGLLLCERKEKESEHHHDIGRSSSRTRARDELQQTQTKLLTLSLLSTLPGGN